MAERTPSPEAQRVQARLRRAYREIEPPDPMLQRVEARLLTGASQQAGAPSPVPRLASARRRRWRLLLAALCMGGSAAAAWRLYAGGSSRSGVGQPAGPGSAPPSGVRSSPPDDAASQSPAAPASRLAGPAAPDGARPPQPASQVTKQPSAHVEGRSAGSPSRRRPAEHRPPGAGDEPSMGARPERPGSESAPTFFDVSPATAGHGRATPVDCLGSYDASAVFPWLGFSAEPIREHLFGEYRCSVRWHSDAPSGAAGQAAAWSLLSIEPDGGALVACSTGRGIRVPAWLGLPAWSSEAPMAGTAEVLLQDRETFSLSFRARRAEPLLEPSGAESPAAEVRQISLSILVTAGALSSLAEHGVMRAAIFYRSAARPPLEGRLECKRGVGQ